MATKMKDAASKFEDPSAIQELIAESEVYGDSLDGERKALVQQVEKLVKSAIDDMQASIKSEEYLEITATVKKFQGFPEETRETWKELETHWNTIVDKEKRTLRELAQSDDPVAIDEALERAKDFGDAFDEERRLCVDRRTDLIQTAKQEMSQLSATRAPPVEEINACLAKYETFPDIRRERDALKSKLTMTTTTIRDALALASRSTDIENVDALLEEHSATGKDADGKDVPPSALLKDAIDELTKHRQKLSDDMSSKLKEATKFEDPFAIIPLLEDAAKYGSSVASDLTSLQVSHQHVLLVWQSVLPAALMVASLL